MSDSDALFGETCTGLAMPLRLKLCWNLHGPTGAMGQLLNLYVLLTSSGAIILASAGDQGGAKQVPAVFAQEAGQTSALLPG